MNLKFIEKVFYIVAVVLMALNFLFDLPGVGKVGYAVLFVSFAISIVVKRMGGRKK